MFVIRQMTNEKFQVVIVGSYIRIQGVTWILTQRD